MTVNRTFQKQHPIMGKKRGNNRNNGRKMVSSKHIFTNTVRAKIAPPQGSGFSSVQFAQLRLAGPLSDQDGKPMAYRPPVLLSKVNPTNLKISTRSPFQKRPLDSESSTNILEIAVEGTQQEVKKTFAIRQLVDLDARQVIVNSIGVQLIPNDFTTGAGASGVDEVLAVITTSVTLLPQIKFDVVG